MRSSQTNALFAILLATLTTFVFGSDAQAQLFRRLLNPQRRAVAAPYFVPAAPTPSTAPATGSEPVTVTAFRPVAPIEQGYSMESSPARAPLTVSPAAPQARYSIQQGYSMESSPQRAGIQFGTPVTSGSRQTPQLQQGYGVESSPVRE